MSQSVRAVVGEAVHIPLLIVLGGLPGVGKTTVARGIARDLSAVHVRIDTIEEVLRREPRAPDDLEDIGYRIGYALALDNLRAGHWVVADAVNPIPLTRDAWRSVGEAARATVVEIEVVCSDPGVHRERVEHREPDIPGATMPTWADVTARRYEPWDPPPARVDTAGVSPAASIRQALTAIMRAQTLTR